jgi:hypothetical protein
MILSKVPHPDEIGSIIDRTPSYSTKHDHLRFACSLVKPNDDGCICEFGVASGSSLRVLANYFPNRELHGFDSFEGLPEDFTDDYPKGAFKFPPPENMPPNVELHIGLFDSTLRPFKSRKPEIYLAHIDSDLYSSAVEIFKVLGENIVDGCVIVMDEFWRFDGWEDHEYLAFKEYIEWSKRSFEFLSHNPERNELSIRIY